MTKKPPIPNIELVRKLRDKTRHGMLDCKKALIESDCDMEKAEEYLKKVEERRRLPSMVTYRLV